MNCPDFDRRFADYIKAWMEALPEDQQDVDELEQQMPAVYEAFLETPADWLNGCRPGEYFEQWDSADLLIDWMGEYIKAHISVPDMLLNRISDLGKAAEPVLDALLDHDGVSNEQRMLAITLLREMDSRLPMARYIAWQQHRGWLDELCDNALDSLEQMGVDALPGLLEGLEGASDAGKEAILSLLSRYPGEERTYQTLIELFQKLPQRRAQLAAYLGRLGDDRALPVLMEAAQEEKLRYLDYIELRNAIEQLGGDPPEREFYDDPEYEALFGLQEERRP